MIEYASAMSYTYQAQEKTGRLAEKLFLISEKKFASTVALYTNSQQAHYNWGLMLFSRAKKRKSIYHHELDLLRLISHDLFEAKKKLEASIGMCALLLMFTLFFQILHLVLYSLIYSWQQFL